MSHPTEEDVVEQLYEYLRRRISLNKFCDWLTPKVWDVEEWGSYSLIALVPEIKLRLAEYTSGHWTESELRNHLAALVEAGVPFKRIKGKG